MKATHNSATGEKPLKWWMYIIRPFWRCQTKTIKEQVECGVSLFDIRIKPYKGVWHFAHGLYLSRKTFHSAFEEISSSKNTPYVMITYEGRIDKFDEIADLKHLYNFFNARYDAIQFCGLSVKNYQGKGWTTIIPSKVPVKIHQNYVKLDWHSWHTIIPIPALWDKFLIKEKDYTKDWEWEMVDFV